MLMYANGGGGKSVDALPDSSGPATGLSLVEGRYGGTQGKRFYLGSGIEGGLQLKDCGKKM